MEMSIDEVILTMQNAKRFTYDDTYEEAFDMAITTMRKYQKIEEISKISTYGIIEKYKRINGVINDGGVDGNDN